MCGRRRCPPPVGEKLSHCQRRGGGARQTPDIAQPPQCGACSPMKLEPQQRMYGSSWNRKDGDAAVSSLASRSSRAVTRGAPWRRAACCDFIGAPAALSTNLRKENGVIESGLDQLFMKVPHLAQAVHEHSSFVPMQGHVANTFHDAP